MFTTAQGPAFDTLCMEVYRFQYLHNPVYRKWCTLVGRTPDKVHQAVHIPSMPIELYKDHLVSCLPEGAAHELVFSSSGSTGSVPSKHYVAYAHLYETSFLKAFQHFYGAPQQWRVLALLPSYLERSDASLVYMVQRLIAESTHPDSGFFLNNLDELSDLLRKPNQIPTLLIGVSFALLELAESFPQPLTGVTIMETGGMKGRRRELTREELHSTLKAAFGVSHIHSEYGMTELLSQAYALRDGRFFTPPWMQLRLRDTNDPFAPAPTGRTGGINVVDLANLYSCSFIATGDLGRSHSDGSVEVLGRFDFSDMRGCNLMVAAP